MEVVVTGGAGYIGAHAVRQLLAAGHRVTIVDNLSTGHRDQLHPQAAFVELDVRDTDRLAELLADQRADCVLHFAAFIAVGESVREPAKYLDNNTGGTRSLLAAMARAGTLRLVFSSTAAVYGEPVAMPIVETMTPAPVNPYGESKWLAEQAIAAHAEKHPQFAFAALRYFNVVGCADDGSIGEHHEPETHLLPLVLDAALGCRPHITVFGTDYATPDGTCVRDYVHVEDLIDAHLAVLAALRPGDRRVYNLGIGHGWSVREVLAAAERVTGRRIPVVYGERRPGDPPALYASPGRIAAELGWRARRSLEQAIASDWTWRQTFYASKRS